jgi:hypothetical protein
MASVTPKAFGVCSEHERKGFSALAHSRHLAKARYVFSVPAGREPLARGGESNERNPGDKFAPSSCAPKAALESPASLLASPSGRNAYPNTYPGVPLRFTNPATN